MQLDRQTDVPPSATEAIDLPGGWSGHVLTGCQRMAPDAAARRNLPTLGQWKAWLSRLATDPAALPDYSMLKYSKDGEVFRARIAAADETLDVVCRQSRPHGFRGVVALCRPSRERRNFDRALTLLGAGINTARPLALIERPAPRRRAWLVAEFVPNLVDLDQIALQLLARLDARRGRHVKSAILAAVVDLFRRLEAYNLRHRDLKASNILLRNWDGVGGRVEVWMVDLDGVTCGKPVGLRQKWRQMSRLAASLLSYPAITRADYARFLLACASAHGTDGEDWKARFRELAKRAATYLRRSRRRKGHKLDGYEGD